VVESLELQTQIARAALESGALRGAALLEALLAIPFRERDRWVDQLLGVEPSPPDMPDLPRGAVPYLPSDVSDIVAMVLEAPLSPADEFVDLGSGLGRVPLLAHLLSGARARGVEIQEHLVRAARARSRALGLRSVSFEHANAAEVELDGSVFFLYAPCNGQMLTAVLGRLEAVARRRPIVVCTVGLEFRGLSWLEPRPTSSVTFCLYDSRVAGVSPRAVGGRALVATARKPR
jgi:SAM-dependent methyltransferase